MILNYNRNEWLTYDENTLSVKAIIGIRIDTPPDKTTYNLGEQFNPTGMVVSAIFDDGTTKFINNDELNFSDISEHSSYVTVKWGTFTANQPIIVKVPTGMVWCFGDDKSNQIQSLSGGGLLLNKSSLPTWGNVFIKALGPCTITIYDSYILPTWGFYTGYKVKKNYNDKWTIKNNIGTSGSNPTAYGSVGETIELDLGGGVDLYFGCRDTIQHHIDNGDREGPFYTASSKLIVLSADGHETNLFDNGFITQADHDEFYADKAFFE